jgi:hypothetical protein
MANTYTQIHLQSLGVKESQRQLTFFLTKSELLAITLDRC